MIGILLAAGFSRRFGAADKLMQPLPDGRSIAYTSAANLILALPESVVVIRKENSALANDYQALGFHVVYCDDEDTEMADSFTKAIRFSSSLQAAANGFVVALADMPYIQPATISGVCEALRERHGIVIPTYLGQRGHPVGFSASFRDELEALTGDEGARAVIKRHPQQVHLLPTQDAGILMDIDVPSDLMR